MRLLPQSLFLALLLFTACNKGLCPENQSNEILAASESHEDNYQKELARLIRLHPDLVLYYFEERILKNEKSYMALRTIGPDFCGILHVWVPREDEHSTKLQNKSGYAGAGLKGLRLHYNDLGLPIYNSMNGISD